VGDLPYWGAKATAVRAAFALAFSAGAHAALIANAPVGPGLRDLSPLAFAAPLYARLVETVASDPAAPRLESPTPSASPPAPAVVASAGAPTDSESAGLPAAEVFYRGSEVDERAEALNVVDIAYPEAALAERVSGVVVLRLLIDHRGVLREVSVRSAQPPGVFEEAALQAARGLRFRPALRNGVPVGSIKVVEVPFDPDCDRTGSCPR
jgi:protein TonB